MQAYIPAEPSREYDISSATMTRRIIHKWLPPFTDSLQINASRKETEYAETHKT